MCRDKTHSTNEIDDCAVAAIFANLLDEDEASGPCEMTFLAVTKNEEDFSRVFG